MLHHSILYSRNIAKQLTSVYLFLLIPFFAVGQIEKVTIERIPPPPISFKKDIPNARVSGALPAMKLPFWDDFSFNATSAANIFYPNDTLWENSRRVWVNNSMGINPPSINVATFDGYDSLGKPYAVNDILAKGFADRMTSRPLRLDLVPAPLRSNVFLNFFYQFQGNGEPPDLGDVLNLYFKDDKGIWNLVWQKQNDGNLDPTKFIEVPIPITDLKYFHNNFQFRFQNFGRLSGPYDTWSIDYVYVSNGKAQYLPVYKDFPDRVITLPLTSIFGEYRSMPVSHFSPSILTKPVVTLSNRRKDQVVGPTTDGQSLKYSSSSKTIIRKKDKTFITYKSVLESRKDLLPVLVYDISKQRNVTLTTLPSILNSIAQDIDSVSVQITFNLDTADNEIKRKKLVKGVLTDFGDYDTAIYKGINFKHNDTTRTIFEMVNYYAYDDGSAEYGAKINGIGTQLAYQYDMKTTESDTIVSFDVYFPRFGDDTPQSIQLLVLNGLTGNESDYELRQSVSITRNNRNKFWRVKLSTPVAVKNKFYIGWKLLSNATLPVGLDVNTDSGSKMFVNTAGDWVQNTSLQGSLMIRPVFGNPGQQQVTTNVADEILDKPFPNPTSGIFHLPSNSTQIVVYDLAGKAVEVGAEGFSEYVRVTVQNPSPSILLVRYFTDRWHTEKILIRP